MVSHISSLRGHRMGVMTAQGTAIICIHPSECGVGGGWTSTGNCGHEDTQLSMTLGVAWRISKLNHVAAGTVQGKLPFPLLKLEKVG